jgi:sirohydrochlorin cobaltochelatase
VKALIIAAHGSRKEESNQEVAALAKRLSQKATGSFDLVSHAFIQFAEPLLEDKIHELVQTGARKIVIFPLFIASGSHILVDIPELVKKTQLVHEQVKITVTRHLGQIDAIQEIILHEVMK